jgi:hypothetical protein
MKSLAENGVKGMTSAEGAESLLEITTKIAAGNTIIVYIAGGLYYKIPPTMLIPSNVG